MTYSRKKSARSLHSFHCSTACHGLSASRVCHPCLTLSGSFEARPCLPRSCHWYVLVCFPETGCNVFMSRQGKVAATVHVFTLYGHAVLHRGSSTTPMTWTTLTSPFGTALGVT